METPHADCAPGVVFFSKELDSFAGNISSYLGDPTGNTGAGFCRELRTAASAGESAAGNV